MSRPRKCRRVCALPATVRFVPDCSQSAASHVTLTIDEYETIRLIDYEGLSQEQCGDQMKVARTTAQQIYVSARKKIAEAIVEGYALVIDGGDYRLCDGQDGQCAHRRCTRTAKIDVPLNEKGGNTLRIAVTYENGQIFQHFGHTEFFKIYDVEAEKVVCSTVISTNGSGHGALADLLKQLNANVLICGGIGGGAQAALSRAGVKLFGGAKGDADAAVEAFLQNKLDYDPNAKCEHHGEHHHDSHFCGERHGGCGEHGCADR